MSVPTKAADVVFERVTKMFGESVAVRDVSFRIRAGALTTLLGPSGCGKTTTLRMIAGLDAPTSGRILVGGEDVTRLPATGRDVTMVFQSYALFPHMTVAENVSYGLRMSGMKGPEARARAEDGLKLVGLGGLGGRLPGELSGGQQQRVAVARALVIEPRVLLLDEPLSNLDARLRRQVRREIRDLQTSLGLTAVYVTHDQDEALAVSDDIIVMNNGSVAQAGSSREIYEEPASVFVASFIGDANLLPATALGGDGEMTRVRAGELEMNLPRRGPATGAVTIAVRPEAVRLSADGGDSVVRGTVREAAYLGGRMEYAVETPLGELFAVDSETGRPLRVGDKAAVSFDLRGVALVGN